MRVGVIGLGNMGSPMAITLRAKGFEVSGCDPSHDRRAMFPGAVASVSALAAIDIALLSLPGPTHVEEVTAQLVEFLPPGGAIVDTSTVAPETTRKLQARASASGIAYVDAPVSGGAAGATAGTLLVMAGGLAADVDRVMPVLAAISRKVVRCGGPGSGNVVKLINNMLCAGHLLLIGEALRMAQAGDVATPDLLDALNAGSGGSRVTEVNVPRWIATGTFDSGFSLALMAKDVGLAADLAGAADLAAEVAARWTAARDTLGGHADFNRIVEVSR
jgi:3-hydroxyisobutyrate dehydrogenase